MYVWFETVDVYTVGKSLCMYGLKLLMYIR